jgi:hypothetical protein
MFLERGFVNGLVNIVIVVTVVLVKIVGVPRIILGRSVFLSIPAHVRKLSRPQRGHHSIILQKIRHLVTEVRTTLPQSALSVAISSSRTAAHISLIIFAFLQGLRNTGLNNLHT